MYPIAIPIVAVMLYASSMYSQTCCTAGMPVSSILEIPKSEKAVLFQLRYEYRSINRLVDNDEVLENDPRSRSGQNISLKTDYVFNKSLAVSAVLPFVQQTRNNSSEKQQSFGVGDLTLMTQYSLKSFSLGAAIKLPTGNVNQRSSSGLLLSPDMMSGSGTYDFLFRLAYENNSFLLPLLSARLNSTYRVNGTNEDFGSTDSFAGRRFAFGNELNLRGYLDYIVTTKKLFFIPHLGLNYRFSGANTEQFVDAPNSGGHWLNIPVGLAISKDGIKTISFFSEIPVYQNLEGLQITTNISVGVQLSYKISRKNKLKTNDEVPNSSDSFPSELKLQ